MAHASLLAPAITPCGCGRQCEAVGGVEEQDWEGSMLDDQTAAMLSFLCGVEVISADEETVSAKNSIVTR